MILTCQSVQRAYSLCGSIGSEMDVDCGRSYGFVSKQGFDRKEVSSIFVKVGTKSMPECMAGDPVFPPQPFFMQGDVPRDMFMVQRPGGIPLLGKEPIPGP